MICTPWYARLKTGRAGRHVRRALARLESQDWEAARRHLTEAVRLDPQCSAAWQDLTCVQTRLGRLVDALASAHRCVETASPARQAEALFNRAVAHVRLHEYSLAAADYTQVVRIEPTCVAAWQALTCMYMRAGQWSMALAYATRVAELAPGDAGGWHRLAECQYRLGSIEETRVSLHRVLALEPRHVRARHNLRGLGERTPVARLQQWYARDVRLRLLTTAGV